MAKKSHSAIGRTLTDGDLQALQQALQLSDATALRTFILGQVKALSIAALKKFTEETLSAVATPSAPAPTAQALANFGLSDPVSPVVARSGGVPPSGGTGNGDGGNGSSKGSDKKVDPARFNPDDMDRAIIAIPLAEAMAEVEAGRTHGKDILVIGPDNQALRPGAPVAADRVCFPVIIDLNVGHVGGVEQARERVHDLIFRAMLSAPTRMQFNADAAKKAIGLLPLEPRSSQLSLPPSLRKVSAQYVFADLYLDEIRELARLDLSARHFSAPDQPFTNAPARPIDAGHRAIYRIWPSHGVSPTITQSMCTIKAEAAVSTFRVSGRGIVWAVIDSGVDGDHVHFKRHRNLVDLPPGVEHRDYTAPVAGAPPNDAPLVDETGHGTHVAGIIAGEFDPNAPESGGVAATSVTWVRNERDFRVPSVSTLGRLCGVAPECKLVSYKVLRQEGDPVDVRYIIAALEHIAEVNNYGRGDLKIHGVNMSLGYPFDPRWFACGESPLCEVVNRLVRYGIFVVVAAGNTGHMVATPTNADGNWQQGAMMTINDPGNAELAITVGSTHRDKPHRYGPSYFSSKGPTGDGRFKPDILAPGEKIISCASSNWSATQSNALGGVAPNYRENSGTSMAAPHVSGAVASFLSVQKEFIGRTMEVKTIFMETATDLKRERYLQGRGVLDLLRALQSV
jgi:serine protease AprX